MNVAVAARTTNHVDNGLGGHEHMNLLAMEEVGCL